MWFEGGAKDAFRRWFTRDPDFDRALERELGPLHDAASRGTLDHWLATARGALALIVLLDQMSRNIHRGDARSFATDAVALAISRELVRTGRLLELDCLEQIVALLPFEHAEDRAAQAEGVRAFEQLVDRGRRAVRREADPERGAERSEAPGPPRGEAVTVDRGRTAAPELVPMLESALDYARRHAAIIERFGRFPHRNAVLGRTSTPDEIAFLREPGSSF